VRDSSRESVTCLRADVNRELHENCVDHERRDENGNGDVDGDWLGCAMGDGSDVRGRWSCALEERLVVVLLTWWRYVVLAAYVGHAVLQWMSPGCCCVYL
jgi:hypothetical protein